MDAHQIDSSSGEDPLLAECVKAGRGAGGEGERLWLTPEGHELTSRAGDPSPGCIYSLLNIN